jgi:hypothetical protein
MAGAGQLEILTREWVCIPRNCNPGYGRAVPSTYIQPGLGVEAWSTPIPWYTAGYGRAYPGIRAVSDTR